jgi:hypothetical protein
MTTTYQMVAESYREGQKVVDKIRLEPIRVISRIIELQDEQDQFRNDTEGEGNED